MNWQFAGAAILIHSSTGFCIELLSGSWSEPENITPSAPEGMSFLKQAELLREGLNYAELHELDHYHNLGIRQPQSNVQYRASM